MNVIYKLAQKILDNGGGVTLPRPREGKPIRGVAVSKCMLYSPEGSDHSNCTLFYTGNEQTLILMSRHELNKSGISPRLLA